jgi:hypothetical protein
MFWKHHHHSDKKWIIKDSNYELASICTYYAEHGDCRFGDRCRIRHVRSEAKFVEKEVKQKVCQYFAKHATCRFGDKCLLKHETVHHREPQQSSSEICPSMVNMELVDSEIAVVSSTTTQQRYCSTTKSLFLFC